MPYELFYWPGIPGRGEFVRLALEEAGADYVDVCRTKGRGTKEMTALMEKGAHPSFAPPFLRDGDVVAAWLKAEEETTLKKWFHEGDRVRLQPMNSTMAPIYTDAANVEVQGKLVAAIRTI